MTRHPVRLQLAAVLVVPLSVLAVLAALVLT